MRDLSLRRRALAFDTAWDRMIPERFLRRDTG